MRIFHRYLCSLKNRVDIYVMKQEYHDVYILIRLSEHDLINKGAGYHYTDHIPIQCLRFTMYINSFKF